MLHHLTEIKDWQQDFNALLQTQAIHALEQGQVLFLPQLSFDLTEHERIFLTPNLSNGKAKNISWNPQLQQLQGTRLTHNEFLKAFLQRFSMSAQRLVQQLFPHYQEALQLGRTSFRPVEVQNRKQSYKKDDTRLHVDAFPANPNQGKRILRVFSNINPEGKARVWRLGEPFPVVAERFLPQVKGPLPVSSLLLHKLGITKSRRSLYDHIMLHIHDAMKADEHYQITAQQQQVDFPAGSSWIVQTDQVSHAAMAGQYILEQTFYLPAQAMQNPAYSPLATLEKLTGKSLV
jgi:hypothetical protein